MCDDDNREIYIYISQDHTNQDDTILSLPLSNLIRFWLPRPDDLVRIEYAERIKSLLELCSILADAR